MISYTVYSQNSSLGYLQEYFVAPKRNPGVRSEAVAIFPIKENDTRSKIEQWNLALKFCHYLNEREVAISEATKDLSIK